MTEEEKFTTKERRKRTMTDNQARKDRLLIQLYITITMAALVGVLAVKVLT